MSARWRVMENQWNLKCAPWRGAIGIEEADDDLAVPAIVCWFMRGTSMSDVLHVVASHNEGLRQ